jgi:hypothetical protein
MPCSSEHMEPNAREIESRRVARLLLYVIPLMERIQPDSNGLDPLRKIVENPYGDTDSLDHYTDQLCLRCKRMTKEQREKIIYNAKSKDARALADWWEAHQEADRKRETKERAEAKRAKIAAAALAKLNPTEREALGL